MVFIDNAVLVAQLQKCQKFVRTLKKVQCLALCNGLFYYPRVIICILLTEWQNYYGIVQKVLVCSDWIHFCWVSKSVRLLTVARFRVWKWPCGQTAAKNNWHHCKEHIQHYNISKTVMVLSLSLTFYIDFWIYGIFALCGHQKVQFVLH